MANGKKSTVVLIAILCVLLIAGIIAAVVVEGTSHQGRLIGGDKDTHGCLVSAGYSWDNHVEACLRSWELDHDQKKAAKTAVHYVGTKEDLTILSVQSSTNCPNCHIVEVSSDSIKSKKVTVGDCAPHCFNKISQKILDVAQNSECTEKGYLTNNYNYNENSGTWWIDLNMKSQFENTLCNPACVIDEKTLTAEINWRCTGVRT